ncbi:DUF2382 domain-containing protein [Rhizobium sp. Leaf341]|uniref:DUF2382 domain-containing protein n=1 Tax=Rhizobium sp. Leaf341 TaxID=1736344 RepID=UPI000712A621|nr:DUF2382 domain-containing protein [Rhizobium sp. Leaf341]KQR73000.1 hypothetical protein ASG03_02315 [Rhizobium sp. Leaf341]
MSVEDDSRIQLVEEQISIDKDTVVTGRVRVTTQSSVVEEVARTTLSGSRVEITRQRIDRQVTDVPQARVEGDVTIIPVLEEVVVVEKRLMLVEEIHVRSFATQDDVRVPVSLRKQTATIERLQEPSQEDET